MRIKTRKGTDNMVKYLGLIVMETKIFFLNSLIVQLPD